MKNLLSICAVFFSVSSFACNSLINEKLRILDSTESESLCKYEGDVLLIVNVASKCGFTPQYKDLQSLYEKYRDQGLEVLGFPCNQFGAQEAGTNEEIQSFCDLTFNVSFKMFDKIEVNGSNASPLFKYLKHESPGILGTEAVKWNFTKFLVNKDGQVVKRFAPKDGESAIESEIQKIL